MTGQLGDIGRKLLGIFPAHTISEKRYGKLHELGSSFTCACCERCNFINGLLGGCTRKLTCAEVLGPEGLPRPDAAAGAPGRLQKQRSAAVQASLPGPEARDRRTAFECGRGNSKLQFFRYFSNGIEGHAFKTNVRPLVLKVNIN